VPAEDADQRKMDRDKNAEGNFSQEKQKTSLTDRQLQRGVVVDHSARCSVLQSERFVTSASRFVTSSGLAFPPKHGDPYKMVTSCGIDVQIYCGNLVDEKVDAIVNPANRQLIHGGGASRAIAEAAGKQLLQECQAYMTKHKELRVTHAIHTTAGKLNPPVMYVIHVAGPSAMEFPNRDDLCQAVFDVFYNCMLYASSNLRISSLAIPAVSSGELVRMF